MSKLLISRSPDLLRLRQKGYQIQVRGGLLLVSHVPYVTTERTVAYGTLISKLSLAGDVTTKPDHVAYFQGGAPCDSNGSPLGQVILSSSQENLAEGVDVDHTFSSKPPDGYPDHYEKMTRYINILLGHAQTIDSEVTAKTYIAIDSEEEESVFRYIDTASDRVGIGAVTAKLRFGKVAIVGLGGTGSYILDLLAKTPIQEIHLFDGDVFSQHNAFRAPGAASLEELGKLPLKVDYLHGIYDKMHRGVIPHCYGIDESNVHELQDMDFVFLSMDGGSMKRAIVEKLVEYKISFIDVGMGVSKAEDSLTAKLRVTVGTEQRNSHIWEKSAIPFADVVAENRYDSNIQIADLNSLNATLAVIKWKKMAGFYADQKQENMSVYTVSGNHLVNEAYE